MRWLFGLGFPKQANSNNPDKSRSERGTSGGWNQRHLAEATGIPQANISRIERGKIEDIYLSRFAILMRPLGVRANYLLGLKEQKDEEQQEETTVTKTVG